MNYSRNSKIFSKGNIQEIFHTSFKNIISAVEAEDENYLLNVNEQNYIEHLANKYSFDCPEIHYEKVYADSYEGDIPAEWFPPYYYVVSGKKYKKQVIQFFIPCSGNTSLLFYTPINSFFMDSGSFEIRGETLIAEYINYNDNAKSIRENYESDKNHIQRIAENLITDIERFNLMLEGYIKSLLQQRKQKLLSQNNLLTSLGIPLRKNENVTSTFSVPKPQLREKIIVKPTVTEKGFKPEPTLDDDNYQKILKLINDVGKNFERMPSLFKDKGEEDLRDHILMVLDPNFESGSASGETFNKTGKTDIQLRHNSSVVFIGECKFWSGEKNYLSTIDQLLGYLTWRDTKGSIIVFVKQKDITAIIEKVKNETPKHQNFLGFTNKSDENWFNYRFHINGDTNREVKLAVQLYHLAK
jgi:hypothetical protein